MPFVSPFTNLNVMLLNDRHPLPWILTEKLIYESPLTGEEYVIPRHFRTDLVSIPKALAALPGVGTYMMLQFFGTGVWMGARESVVHDWLRRPNKETGVPPVAPVLAHRIFREALYFGNYTPEMIELYYRAVTAFDGR